MEIDQKGFAYTIGIIALAFILVGVAYWFVVRDSAALIPPVLSAISPTSGPAGTAVTLTGAHFSTTSAAIKFGSGYIHNFEYLNQGMLRFTVPDGLDLCPPAQIQNGRACPEAFPPVTPGIYGVRVVSLAGESNELSFKVEALATSTKAQSIQTDFGELTLLYENGTAMLTGTLSRSTPCVEWRATVSTSKDLPPSSVDFILKRKSTAEVCIQVLGTPQKILISSPAAQNAEYTVIVQEKTVFTGTLEAED